jgi:hypothetical protein
MVEIVGRSIQTAMGRPGQARPGRFERGNCTSREKDFRVIVRAGGSQWDCIADVDRGKNLEFSQLEISIFPLARKNGERSRIGTSTV